METKLCRICGELGESHLNLFESEDLRYKIETCLPIVINSVSLLPDTICVKCNENVDKFYKFTKICLENIVVLETKFGIVQSCLKTKRKHDKSTSTDGLQGANSQHVQTDDFIDVFLSSNSGFVMNFSEKRQLVDYELSDTEEANVPTQMLQDFERKLAYFDDAENDLISEIAQRKKRKRSTDANGEESGICRKIAKLNRRKNMQPKRLQHSTPSENLLPQICLLCDEQFDLPMDLAAHVFDTHGIDMAEILASQNVAPNDTSGVDTGRRKKLPNLVKISDLKRNNDGEDCLAVVAPVASENTSEEPPKLVPTFVCSLCPAMFTARSILFEHLRQKHPQQSALLCGLCLFQAQSPHTLAGHLETCKMQQLHQQQTKYICQICRYGDDNVKALENHVLVHTFLLDACKQKLKMFDAADYIELNENFEPAPPQFSLQSHQLLVCSECNEQFEVFKEFSAHRRLQHSIFHCDLCNKFYGRNSHLWKHVNRLHKGHPSITCQLCFKTSASKYHLAQHFNKIHSNKPCKQSKTAAIPVQQQQEDDFMLQEFQAFDFQSVKQSFRRQELMDKEEKLRMGERENNAEGVSAILPKEIDSSSDLYTNIITNYTPPANKGEFKCLKCGKGFQKKNLLKKHKKNCRPRLQKDLLTRCKSCARIFKDRQSLAKHLVNYHSDYQCEICQQQVQSKCEIVAHIRFTHPKCHLICPMCENILRSRQDLQQHINDHHNSYICQFCGDSLPSKIKLKMHILSLHRKILSLSCGICLKLFESQHILRDHVKLVHKNELQPLTSCSVCGKNYGSKWKTFDHLTKSHGRIFKACKMCLDVFDTEAELEKHWSEVHTGQNYAMMMVVKNGQQQQKKQVEKSEEEVEEDGMDEDEYFEAPQAQIAAQSLLEKRLLMGEHHQKQPMQNSSKRTVYVNSNDPSFCEICHKTWPAKKHLWQHYIRCHKQVAATICGICLKTNQTYASLQRHLITTHPTLLHGQGFGSNFICKICGRYHNASSKLKLHMVIHENFDWNLLVGQTVEEGEKEEEKGEEEVVVKSENGYEEEEEDGGIDYNNLIEQVECSSDEEEKMEGIKEEDEEDEEEDGGISDSSDEDNCMETEMLQNMFREKQQLQQQRNQDEMDVKKEQQEEFISSSEEDGFDNEDEEDDEDVDEEDGVMVEEDSSNSCFEVRTDDESDEEVEEPPHQQEQNCELLDTAIQSITAAKYEDSLNEEGDELVSDYDEEEEEVTRTNGSVVESGATNENEIDAAVGSIL